jgi:hypothetical protein
MGLRPNSVRGLDWPDAGTAAAARARHLLQVQAADAFVGGVITRLRRLGVYDDTLLVVTADHGVAFRPRRPIRGLSRATASDIAWVPLLIKAPGQTRGGPDDRPAESIDIVPTIAAHLGIDVPWDVDGRSLLGARRTEARFPMLDWYRNVWRPEPGTEYLRIPRAPGFAKVLTSRAAGPGASDDLRIFAVGRYGDLVGRAAPPLVAAPDPHVAQLDDPTRYLGVDVSDPKIPFVSVHGSLDLPVGRTVAVVVNGTIAGLGTSEPAPESELHQFRAVLAPQLFHDGDNDVQAYAVDGTPADPHLHLMRSGSG